MSVNNILSNGKIASQYLPGASFTPSTEVIGGGVGSCSNEDVGVILLNGTEPFYGVVAGGVYIIQGMWNFTTGGTGFNIIVTATAGASDVIIINSEASPYNGGALSGVNLPFCCVLVADTDVLVFNCRNEGGGAIGVTSNVTLTAIQITRIA